MLLDWPKRLLPAHLLQLGPDGKEKVQESVVLHQTGEVAKHIFFQVAQAYFVVQQHGFVEHQHRHLLTGEVAGHGQ